MAAKVIKDTTAGRMQDVGGLHSGFRTTITPGDPLGRSMGHYGKAPAYLSPMMAGSTDVVPTGGHSAIRGGEIRRRVRTGAFGPGMPGTSKTGGM